MLPDLTSLKKNPVTLIVAVIAIIGAVFFEPKDIVGFEALAAPFDLLLSPVKLIAASFLHIHVFHLLTNLVLWTAAGLHLESKMGSKQLLLVSLAAILFGGFLETIFVNPDFVGLSSACYGLIGVIIWRQVGVSKGLAFGLIVTVFIGAVDSTFNWIASPDKIAYGAHFGGLMAGFFSSLGLGQSKSDASHPVFRPMSQMDIKPVLDIIYAHDEDDAAEAQATFQQTLEDKFVLDLGGRVIGMTGYRPEPDTRHAAWLSFTYIQEDFRKTGNAYWMMLQLRDVLEARGIERLFIATSDYIDEETGEDIYLAARNFYENKLNAEREIRLENFYAPDEARYIYSLPVIDRTAAPTPPPDGVKARFVGLDEASESDTSYVVVWEEQLGDTPDPDSKLATKSLQDLVAEVSTYSGRALFVTLPDYISDQHSRELREAGFRDLGTLRDYFSKGVGEVHWGLYFA